MTVAQGEAGLGRDVDALLLAAEAHYVDLGFVAPDGILELPIHDGSIRAIRLEAPGECALSLQAIGIETAGDGDPLAGATVATSGLAPGAPHPDAARLFAGDRPSGVTVQAPADGPAWLEVRFPHDLSVRRIRIRNVADDRASGARGLRVVTKGRWRTRTVYDGEQQLRAWRHLVAGAREAATVAGDGRRLALLTVLDLTVRGEYARARRALPAKVADEADRRAFRVAINRALLPARGLEWTDHGAQRPFRFWSEAEKVDYIRDSVEVVDALRSLTPNVCLGFGSVLAVVRDRAPIPHDDDLDVIIAFEPDEAATIAEGLARIEAHLRPLGFDVTGSFDAHRHVRRPGRKPVDVFVGLFEGEAVAWYPSARGGLTRDIVFPPSPADLLGVACTIPARAEVYLERVYGAGWRVPDPLFAHPWNKAEFADIAGTGPAGTTAAQHAGDA